MIYTAHTYNLPCHQHAFLLTTPPFRLLAIFNNAPLNRHTGAHNEQDKQRAWTIVQPGNPNASKNITTPLTYFRKEPPLLCCNFPTQCPDDDRQ